MTGKTPAAEPFEFSYVVPVVGRDGTEYERVRSEPFVIDLAELTKGERERGLVLTFTGEGAIGGRPTPMTITVRLPLADAQAGEAIEIEAEPFVVDHPLERMADRVRENGRRAADLAVRVHGADVGHESAQLLDATERLARSLEAVPAAVRAAPQPQLPPIVVNVPEQAPPVVNVNVPKQAPPVVNVEAPAPAPTRRTARMHRGQDNRIDEVTIVDEPS